jgi:hypothetical protein
LDDTIQQTAADTASEASIEAVVTKASPAQIEAAFNRASIAYRRSAPPEEGLTPGHGGWRDGSEPTELSPMPAAPVIATSEVDNARATLNERSGGHSDLVARWGDDFAPNFAYAKAAFKDIAANRPDLIAKFEKSGLGDDASVIEHLAQFGRQQAGRLGDFTIARNHNSEVPMTMPTFIPPTATSQPTDRTSLRALAGIARPPSNGSNNNGSLETRGELNRMLAANPPGSPGYKTNSKRITEDDDSDDVPQDVLDRMKELRVEQRGLKQRLDMLDAKLTGVIPHPSAVKRLAKDVDTLHKMLKDHPDDPECRMALGNLLERVLVHPTGSNLPYDVSLYARHAAYIGELPMFPEFRSKKPLGNQPVMRINIGNAIVPS